MQITLSFGGGGEETNSLIHDLFYKNFSNEILESAEDAAVLNVNEKIDDHKMCICGEILKGLKTPKDCKVFAKGCDPTNPLGSCMVSDEGACNAYYRYDRE